MPITILDLVLLGVMLISGLLAMVRGFMREILSIAAWGAAALVTLYAFAKLLPTAKAYFSNDTFAAVAVVAGTFIGTLIVVSVITVRISDMILDFADRRARPHARIPLWVGPRPFDRGGRVPVLQLAGPGQAAAGLDHRCEVPGGAAGNRGLVNVALAGRPREHHLKEILRRINPKTIKLTPTRQPLRPAMATASLPATALKS